MNQTLQPMQRGIVGKNSFGQSGTVHIPGGIEHLLAQLLADGPGHPGTAQEVPFYLGIRVNALKAGLFNYHGGGRFAAPHAAR
jgi:hypothetical protein